MLAHIGEAAAAPLELTHENVRVCTASSPHVAEQAPHADGWYE